MILVVMMICILIINNIILIMHIKKGKNECAFQVLKEGMIMILNARVMKNNDAIHMLKINIFSSCSIGSMKEHTNCQAWLRRCTGRSCRWRIHCGCGMQCSLLTLQPHLSGTQSESCIRVHCLISYDDMIIDAWDRLRVLL